MQDPFRKKVRIFCEHSRLLPRCEKSGVFRKYEAHSARLDTEAGSSGENRLSVYIYSQLVRALEEYLGTAVVSNVGAELSVAALGIFADKRQESQAADFFYNEYVHKSVVRLRIGHGVEAAAVIAAVACADKGKFAG